MGNSEDINLTPNQERAIAALLVAPSIRKAAEEAKVSERVLFKWLKIPVFKSAYREAQRESFKHSIALCQRVMPHAVQTLTQIMTDKAATSAAVSAATALMKYGRESIELDDVVERVETLEQEAAKANQS